VLMLRCVPLEESSHQHPLGRIDKLNLKDCLIQTVEYCTNITRDNSLMLSVAAKKH
jgi:hypothetical protein